ncbi:MAG TPA: MFS transporter [Candidatus Acidoferrales bacterium]|nr:MFS transporter [Candidatus Acidoferrales bacterium]
MPLSFLPRDSRWTALYVLCIGMLMIVLDNTVVNVALPSIATDLHFSQSALAWVVNAYLIAFAGLLLLSGRLGDLIGTKRVFIIGLALFTGFSLLCGFAWSGTVLIVGRYAQGVGGAMASAVILAMIFTTFTEPGERAKAMGIFSFTAAAGGSIGLLIGGALTQLLNWHWVFFVNVPIGIVTIAIAQRVLPSGTGIGLRQGADAIGAFLVTASLMLGVYTVVDIPTQPAHLSRTLLLGAIACALFVAFVVRQAMAAKPLVPLRIFASRNLCASNIIDALVAMGLFGFFFLDALYLRQVLHYDALRTGLAFLPTTLTIGVLSLGAAEGLERRFGSRRTLIGGTAVSAAGMLLLTIAPNGAYYATILPAMLLIGAGLGAAFPPLMTFAMTGASQADAGVISGVINTTSEVGGAIGLAILATVAAGATQSALASGSSTTQAFGAGYQLAFAIATACLFGATLIAITMLRDAPLLDDDLDDLARRGVEGRGEPGVAGAVER